jgi:hypothetical protein
MTPTDLTVRCTTCGHGPQDHQALSPQCSAARCTCLKYRPPLAVAPRPAAPPATRPTATTTSAPPAIDDLVRACARSEYKRTQTLGVKLADIAEKARTALRAEREAAEAKAARSKEVAAAQAEVKRLEMALAEAKKKAVAAGAPGGARSGPHNCPECDQGFGSAQALGAHRARKHGYRRDQSA